MATQISGNVMATWLRSGALAFHHVGPNGENVYASDEFGHLYFTKDITFQHKVVLDTDDGPLEFRIIG